MFSCYNSCIYKLKSGEYTMICDDMDREIFLRFLKDESEEMKKHKWIESEKVGRDLGNIAILDWIKKYAASYRCWWENTHSDAKIK